MRSLHFADSFVFGFLSERKRTPSGDSRPSVGYLLSATKEWVRFSVTSAQEFKKENIFDIHEFLKILLRASRTTLPKGINEIERIFLYSYVCTVHFY